MTTVLDASSLVEQIGDAAGQVWHYLNQNGPRRCAGWSRTLHVLRDVLMQAIGWLAREDKVSIDTESGRAKTVSLHEHARRQALPGRRGSGRRRPPDASEGGGTRSPRLRVGLVLTTTTLPPNGP